MQNFKTTFYITLLFCSTLLFLFSFYNIIVMIDDSVKTLKLSERLKYATNILEVKSTDTTLFNPPNDMNDSTWLYENESFLEIDFTNLLKENDETVGYIEVGGTEISYPVVKSIDNEYYLNHSFDKKSNKSGWIFLDYRNNFLSLSGNTIIYGHKIKDGTMFTKLNDLLDEEWFLNLQNHIVKISTPTENMVWQIFSVYTIKEESYYLKTYFANSEDYQKFIDTIKKRSLYDFNTSVDMQDKILTLSTCFNTKGERTVVHAKLIKKGFHS